MYDWPIETAMKVCANESQGYTKATNPEHHPDASCHGSFGLFQVACVHGLSEERLHVPEVNIKFAYELWKQSGWWPWGVCHDGKVNCKLALK